MKEAWIVRRVYKTTQQKGYWDGTRFQPQANLAFQFSSSREAMKVVKPHYEGKIWYTEVNKVNLA